MTAPKRQSRKNEKVFPRYPVLQQHGGVVEIRYGFQLLCSNNLANPKYSLFVSRFP